MEYEEQRSCVVFLRLGSQQVLASAYASWAAWLQIMDLTTRQYFYPLSENLNESEFTGEGKPGHLVLDGSRRARSKTVSREDQEVSRY